MNKYRVVEKFVSINGEGSKAGQLTSFVRFQGCNLKCSYCDTDWANEDDADYILESKTEIADWLTSTGVKNVTLTGGEPLLQENLVDLLKELNNRGLSVEIETNGSVDISDIVDMGDRGANITLDYKLPCSGMEKKMNMDNYKLLRKSDTVKFVVGSTSDLDKAKTIIDEYSLTEKCNIYFSAVFGSIEPAEIVNYMVENNINGVNLQLQMHKFIWDPDMRGV